MKNFLSFLVLCFYASEVHAQTEKSTLMVGGEMLLLSQADNTVFTATPNIGVFFTNNFAAGAEVTLITGNGNSVWGVGPYVRGYFGGSDRGKLFAQLGVEIAGISGIGGSNTAFTPRAGYAVFLNRSIALEVAARLITGQGSTIFGAGAGFQIHLK